MLVRSLLTGSNVHGQQVLAVVRMNRAREEQR